MPKKLLADWPARADNEWYAIAKIAGVKLCQAYRRRHGCDFLSVMPTNLYGPTTISALLAKIDAAVGDGRDTVEI